MKNKRELKRNKRDKFRKLVAQLLKYQAQLPALFILHKNSLYSFSFPPSSSSLFHHKLVRVIKYLSGYTLFKQHHLVC